MKISFGKFKNREITVGDNKMMRPTTSMVKSIIINTIDDVKGLTVLDLFSGTGAFGFEMLSLGAKKVIFVDKNIESFKAIKTNIKKFELEKMANVFKTDFRIALKNIDFKLDIIFIDPPFIADKYYDESLELIFSKQLLNKNGIIIVEKQHRTSISNLDNWELIKLKKIGEKDLLFLKNKND